MTSGLLDGGSGVSENEPLGPGVRGALLTGSGSPVVVPEQAVVSVLMTTTEARVDRRFTGFLGILRSPPSPRSGVGVSQASLGGQLTVGTGEHTLVASYKEPLTPPLVTAVTTAAT